MISNDSSDFCKLIKVINASCNFLKNTTVPKRIYTKNHATAIMMNPHLQVYQLLPHAQGYYGFGMLNGNIKTSFLQFGQ